MRSENMFAPIVETPDNAPDFNSSAPKIVSIQVTEKPAKKSKSRERSTKSQPKPEAKPEPAQKTPSPQKAKKEHPLKNAKQDLPGNRHLSEEERAKLPKSRTNRYGVFPPNDGNTEFDKAVENQRRKMAPKEPTHSDEIEEDLNPSTDPLSEESVDHVPVRESSRPFTGARREVLNQPASLKQAPSLPGTMNIKQQAEE